MFCFITETRRRLSLHLPGRGIDASRFVLSLTCLTPGLSPETRATSIYSLQPLAGGAPIPLTQVDAESSNLVAYAWSGDGRKIAITRGRLNDSDVVMFSGFR
ncbi:MAG TPA: hypothetical protein VE083_05850 [Terriglobales bacterium]|nr:hypothetical protein [Terriglobales bacterium]